jgi:hypothetical protein
LLNFNSLFFSLQVVSGFALYQSKSRSIFGAAFIFYSACSSFL